MTKTQYALLAVTILMIVSGTIIALFRSLEAGIFIIIFFMFPLLMMWVLDD